MGTTRSDISTTATAGTGQGATTGASAAEGRRFGALASAGLGAGLGAGWGIVARAWMRLISDNPEFSWSGTLFIVMAPTVIGGLLGLASARRQVGRALPSRSAAGVSMMLLGVGAGMLMLPTIYLGSLALARQRFPWPVRVVAVLGVVAARFLLTGAGSSTAVVWAAVAIGTVALLVGIGWRTREIIAGVAILAAAGVMWSVLVGTDLPWWRVALGAATYAPLVLAPTLAMTIVFRPVLPARTNSRHQP